MKAQMKAALCLRTYSLYDAVCYCLRDEIKVFIKEQIIAVCVDISDFQKRCGHIGLVQHHQIRALCCAQIGKTDAGQLIGDVSGEPVRFTVLVVNQCFYTGITVWHRRGIAVDGDEIVSAGLIRVLCFFGRSFINIIVACVDNVNIGVGLQNVTHCQCQCEIVILFTPPLIDGAVVVTSVACIQNNCSHNITYKKDLLL